MHTPRSHGEHGIALLVVMMLGAIIVPFAAEFAYQISIESMTANNVTDQLAIDNAIESQYQIVLARLEYDGVGNQTDTYDDAWNEDELLQRTEESTGVNVSTTVFDEQSKLNVHMLAEASPERRAVWKQRFVALIERFRRDTKFDAGGRAEEIAEELARWVTGRTSRGTVPKPKRQDDRAMLIVDELHFTSEIFAKERLLEDIREGEEVAPGLHRYITIHGTGKVNLNTAPKVVLQAIFNKDIDIADRIIERRSGQTEEMEVRADETGESGNPFADPNQVLEVEGVTQPLLLANKVIPGEDFDVRSNFFSLRIAAQASDPGSSRKGLRREELFIVERVPGTDPNGEIEGFRHLLCQERTDPLEPIEEE